MPIRIAVIPWVRSSHVTSSVYVRLPRMERARAWMAEADRILKDADEAMLALVEAAAEKVRADCRCRRLLSVGQPDGPELWTVVEASRSTGLKPKWLYARVDTAAWGRRIDGMPRIHRATLLGAIRERHRL